MTTDERLVALLAEFRCGETCRACNEWTERAAALRDAGYVHRDEVAGAWRRVEEYLTAAGAPDSEFEKYTDAALAAVTEHLGGEG